MLDIKLIREKIEEIRSSLKRRGAGVGAELDNLLVLDNERRKCLSDLENLRSEKKIESGKVGKLKAAVKKLESAKTSVSGAIDFACLYRSNFQAAATCC